MVRWLDRVGPVLLTLGILGILIELKTPGFGVPGILGLVLVAVFFMGQHAAGMAEAWEIILFIIGVGLVAIEVFVIPGFGFVGIAGLLCMLASVILALQPFYKPTTPADWAMFEVNMISVGAVTLAVFIGAILIGRYLHRAPYLGKLVLAAPPSSTSPTTTSQSVLAMPSKETVQEEVSGLVGRQGRAVSLLRPAGRAEFDGEPMDVVTQGEFIQPGEPIVISEVHGNRVVVKRRPSAGS
jgi:membrane-bound serine protease (ClpP class)